jgi:hypothetical protein
LPDKVGTPHAVARYHMLPVMATVPYDAGGRTIGDLLQLPGTAAAWEKLRSKAPGCVHWEQWVRDHDRAVAVLRDGSAVLLSEPVVMHCEVQVMISAAVHVRHNTHELYKLKRADTPELLYSDVKPAHFWEKVKHVEEDNLRVASHNGMISTVERLLFGGRGGRAEGAAGTDPDDRKVRWLCQRLSSTPAPSPSPSHLPSPSP